MHHAITLHESASSNAPPDLASEVARLETELSARRAELATLQEDLRVFKTLYTRTVGSRLAELEEVEAAIREAESRTLGVDAAAEEEDAEEVDAPRILPKGQAGLRKLFWSVAKLFHPDHAADEAEAERRHTIMSEASRAYRDGDAESLHTLLGDELLQSYCATSSAARDAADEAGEDLSSRLLNVKEELRTTEFGIKRIKQDGLYKIKLTVDEEAAGGRDALAEMAARLDRRTNKARHRLAHFS